jgi:hypothetical protein
LAGVLRDLEEIGARVQLRLGRLRGVDVVEADQFDGAPLGHGELALARLELGAQLRVIEGNAAAHLVEADANDDSTAQLGIGEALGIGLVGRLEVGVGRRPRIGHQRRRHEDRVAATLLLAVAVKAIG